MTKFLAGVLSVIAVGVLLIAYGLLSPRAAAFGTATPDAAAMLASERIMLRDGAVNPYAAQAANPYAPANPYAYDPRFAPAYGYPNYPYSAAPAPQAAPVRTVVTEAPVQRVQRTQRVVERAPRRDWKKTAAVIGGSSAAGAGVGAIFGGKKGALIGAAIGGGAATIYESTKR